MSSDPLNLIEIESNDTFDTAASVPITTETPHAIAIGTINFDFENNRDVDATEDVDLYAFELAVGDTIKLDLDSAGETFPLDFAELILFDSEGNNLAQGSFFFPAPDDAFISYLPYIEYTVTEAGTYYAGVSSFINTAYDPLTAGSGSGTSFEGFGEQLNSFGDYMLGFELVNDSTLEDSPPPPSPSEEMPPADAPTVSLESILGTYGLDGEIVTLAPVETVSDLGFDPFTGFGGAAINFLLTVDGPIPTGGIEVILNTDANLAEYLFTFVPFIRGGEVLGPVLDADGNPSGMRLNLTQNTTLLNLNLFDKPIPETDGPEQIVFALESSEANISPAAATSTVTVYDTVADVPPVLPSDLTVGLTVENSALIEADGNTTTFTFTLSEPPPPEGVLIYVNATEEGQNFDEQTFGLLGQFNVFGIEVTGGVFPVPNFSSSGFYFKVTEQTATITASAFSDDIVEGVQAFQVSLEAGTDYQVDPAANEVTVTVADTAESLPQLSLSVEPTTLVESEGTVLVQTFNLSTAPPPEGIEVSMIATGLEEFDLTNIETTGIAGEIAVAESEPPRLIFMMTEATATISLPVADDGISEEVETIIFTLEPNESYQVSPAAGTGSFQIVDVPADIPTPPAEVEVNDSLETAIAINLSAGNPVTIFGEADYFYDFSETSPILDFSEDVDLYSFELLAGESIAVDVDAIALDGSESLLQPVLRIFDANGGELDSVGQVDTLEEITPGEGEATLTFTAETAGTYYAGISVLGNDDYDPTVIGSGSGWTLDGVAEPDAYQVTFSTPSSGPGEMLVGTDGADTLTGTDGDEVLDGLAGDDTYTGGTGADQFVLAIAQGVDTITDFEVGVDQISLGGLTPEGVRFFEMGSETFLLTNSNELLGVVQGVTGLDSSVFA